MMFYAIIQPNWPQILNKFVRIIQAKICAKDVLTRPILVMVDLSTMWKLMVCFSTWKPASAIFGICYALVENVPLLSLQDVLLPGESSGYYFQH